MSASPTRTLSLLLALVLVLAPVRTASAAPNTAESLALLTLQSTGPYTWQATPSCVDVACEFQREVQYADAGGSTAAGNQRNLLVIGVIVLVVLVISASGGGDGGGIY